jgi:hypothetical protein
MLGGMPTILEKFMMGQSIWLNTFIINYGYLLGMKVNKYFKIWLGNNGMMLVSTFFFKVCEISNMWLLLC